MADRTGISVSNCSHQANGISFQLPPEIISIILSWLPIEDILRCRSVCKAWYVLTSEPHFINLQLTRALYGPPRVMLIPISENSVCLLDNKQRKVREIPLHIMAWFSLNIMGSCNGFLCLASYSSPNPVVVCNPITRDYLALPNSMVDFFFICQYVCLGYDPWSKKYKIVRAYLHSTEFNKFQIITMGESSWRQLDASFRVLSGDIEGPVHCDGVLYWIINKNVHSLGHEYILAFDLRDEKFQAITFPPNIRMPRYNPDWHDGNLQLLNVAGCITLVEDEYRLMHIWQVMRKRNGGYSIQYHAFDMYVRWNVFSRPVLVDVVSRDCLLLEVSKFGLHWERDLVLYFLKKKQYVSIQIHGLPSWFRSSSLRPNLVSPVDALVSDESDG